MAITFLNFLVRAVEMKLAVPLQRIIPGDRRLKSRYFSGSARTFFVENSI
jgi:hypothetical protein